MANLHAYAAPSTNWLAVLAIIAFVSALSSIGLYKAVDIYLQHFQLENIAKTYGWLVSPLTFTSVFSFCFKVFDSFLWKYCSGIPCLSGTWIGFTTPNYQDWEHLVIMKIDQTWSDISIENFVFYKNLIEDKWEIPLKELGVDTSETAFISGKSNNNVSLTIVYNHRGMKNLQPNFSGTMLAVADLASENYEMRGRLYTNRRNEKENIFGTDGTFRLARISKKHLKPRKAFLEAKKRRLIDKIKKI